VTTPDSSPPIGLDINQLAFALGGRGPVPPWHAREALEAIGSPAVPALIRSLGSFDPATRWEAAKALSDIADPSAVQPLLAALEDEDGSVRWLAAEGLSRIGYPALAPLLHALIDHSGSAWLRDGARHVLRGNLNDELASILGPVLVALTGPGPEISVMAPASRAIRLLESVARPSAAVPAPRWPSSRLPSLTPAHGRWRNLRF
jgi:HEAT repeat protein